ncbi:MAG: ROK family glucokinase [bacterium]|nr:ROK family glucokinase [bacterium]
MNTPYAIGIDLGGTFIKSALVDEQGHILTRLEIPTKANDGFPVVVAQLQELTQQLVDVACKNRGEVVGACVATPGLVDFKTGIVRVAPNFARWVNVPLLPEMQKGFSFPYYIENDANAAAFGEKWMGAGKDNQTVIVLTIGTGIGGGLIFDGKIWHGADGAGGEPGHINLIPDGLQCGCGNYGCLEAYASATGIVKRTIIAIESGETTKITELVSHDLSKITSKLVYEAAVAGDKLARKILLETGKYLGIGIATLINLLNPEMVILGGGVMKSGDWLLIPAREEVKKRAFKFLAERTAIVLAKLGNDAGMIGAAGVVFADINARRQRPK